MDVMPPLHSRPSRREGAIAIVRRVMRSGASDRISLTAAGCAFYAMLALFPAIFLLVLIYGLAFDKASVEPQLEVLRELVPEETFQLIAARLHELVGQPRPRLEWGAIVSGADEETTGLDRAQLDLALPLLAAPGAERIPLRGSVGRIVLVADRAGAALLSLAGLASAPDGYDYEAWVIPPESATPLPAGVFDGRERIVLLSRAAG